MNKIVLFMFLSVVISLSAEDYKKEMFTGSWISENKSENAYLTGKEYREIKAIELFASGRFALYDYKMHSLNEVDKRYTPLTSGVYEVSRDLLFLMATDGSVYIFKIDSAEALTGTVSGNQFIRLK